MMDSRLRGNDGRIFTDIVPPLSFDVFLWWELPPRVKGSKDGAAEPVYR